MSSQRVLVKYPSGKRAILVGDFLGPGYIDGEGWRTIDAAIGWPAGVVDDVKAVAMHLTKASYVGGQRMEADSVVMLDPRAVCEDDETGDRLFEPSLLTPGTCRWVTDWLQEHPSWPSKARES